MKHNNLDNEITGEYYQDNTFWNENKMIVTGLSALIGITGIIFVVMSLIS